MITNDHEAIGAPEEARKACAFRWKMEEEYHREVTQVPGTLQVASKRHKVQYQHIVTAL